MAGGRPVCLCRAGGLEQFCGSEKAKEGYFQSFCDGVMSASVEEELASQVSSAVRAVACDVEPAAQNAQCAKHEACSMQRWHLESLRFARAVFHVPCFTRPFGGAWQMTTLGPRR